MATKATKAAAKPATKTPVLKTEAKADTKAVVKAEKKVEKKVEAAPAKAEKKAPAKKAVKEIKTSLVLQYAGKDIADEEVVKLIKKAWKKAGNKMADIKTIKAYIQPENNCVYAVVNGVELGPVSLDAE